MRSRMFNVQCFMFNELSDGLYHVLIDFLSVVLHPSGLGVVLLVVNVGASQHVALFVEQQCLGG